jgi:hypothetical protein
MEIYFNREHLLNEIEYPNRYRPERLVKTAGIIFTITLVFLFLYKPFGVNESEHKMNYFLICGLHAFLPAIILYGYFSVVNYLGVKDSKFKNWTLLREYGHIGILLLLIGLANFLTRDLIYQHTDNWSWIYLWEEIRNCFIAGTLFYFLMRFATFYFQSKKDSSLVFQFTPLSSESKTTVLSTLLFIKTQVKQDDFSLNIDNLLFVKAEGNYIELTTCSNSMVNTELKRISLTQFESQISSYPNFFRCHRAYLVNMLQVEKVSGNSQGYLLAFNNGQSMVPVSRSQLDAFNSLYQQLSLQYSA